MKLSICIATFRREKFIAQTLDSIVGQLGPEVELVVVDGASPDRTAGVVEPYRLRHPGLRYFRETVNSGVDGDYDKAVAYARGEYCWLMTDDDLLNPGAVERVLAALDGQRDLVVVDTEVKSVDFSAALDASLFNLPADRVYGPGDEEAMFGDLGSGLSFIGSVVIKRAVWLGRPRSPYYGSLFVHFGVIFQDPPLARVAFLARPLVAIRYGNSMWAPRAFEVSMIKWPRLVWSFERFSEGARDRICRREPWRKLGQLAFMRAIGAYNRAGYGKFVTEAAPSRSKAMAWCVAISPAFAWNLALSLYCLCRRRPARSQVYAMARSPHATWAARLAARSLRLI